VERKEERRRRRKREEETCIEVEARVIERELRRPRGREAPGAKPRAEATRLAARTSRMIVMIP
jgi:hypothetical protein